MRDIPFFIGKYKERPGRKHAKTGIAGEGCGKWLNDGLREGLLQCGGIEHHKASGWRSFAANNWIFICFCGFDFVYCGRNNYHKPLNLPAYE